MAGEEHVARRHPLARLVVPVGHGEAVEELRGVLRAHLEQVWVDLELVRDAVLLRPLVGLAKQDK